MKTSKVTKKEIKETLRGKNLNARERVTAIFKLAKMCGVDVSSKGNVFKFIQENATSDKVYSSAYHLSYGAADFKNFRCYKGAFENVAPKMKIATAIAYAKQFKSEDWGNYTKRMFVGNNNIYWAHPGYGHSDYNKSIAFDNNEKNQKVATLINKFLGYNN